MSVEILERTRHPLVLRFAESVMSLADAANGEPIVWRPDSIDPTLYDDVKATLEDNGYVTEVIDPGKADVGYKNSAGLSVRKRNAG